MNEETLFHRALQCPPAERAAFLLQECGGDTALRGRVEILLEAYEHPDGFLQGPPAGVRHPSASPATPGEGETSPPLDPDPARHVGPYKLLQQIGEGGMGTVYMAEQTEPVKRRVALKVIKLGMDSRQIIARFEAERQALALMDHPNIAKVLDASTTADGRPFFVMELVKGLPITKYCDERRLPPRQRLELFVPVCRAVQHAHQKGIIHRDLKPSNVLVALYDGKAVPKVIDFGMAKATGPKLTNKTLFTEFGAVVGTLEYMSPEQAELNQLDVDTRSDVYSLGVLLYELLTGTTPLEGRRLKESSLLEALRLIREEEPPRPSTRLGATTELPVIAAKRNLEPKKLSLLVRGELDWIVMKCLEKDRNRRYETANGLARDLEGYLADEPVQACPPSAGYKLRKFLRRNKRVVPIVAVLVAALLLIVGTIAGSLGWVLRDREARRTRADGAIQEALRGVVALQAERRWREALASIQRVEELLATVEENTDLQQSVYKHRRDLEMVLRIEELRSRQGEIKQGVLPYAEADAKFAQAFRDYGIDVEALDPSEAGERLRARAIAVELAVALDDWAAVQRKLEKNGRTGWKHLVAIACVADPDPWRVRLRDARQRQDRQVLAELAASVDVQTVPKRVLHRLGKDLEALGEWDRAAKLLVETQRLYPNDFWINSELAYALDNVKPPQSLAAARYAAIAAALRNDNEVMHLNLGYYLAKIGQYDDAIAAYRRAIELYPGYVEAYDKLHGVLALKGYTDTAIAVFTEAVRRKPDLAKVHYYLGAALKKKGELDSALASLREAIRLDPALAGARQEILGILVKQGNTSEAQAAFQGAVAACQEAIRLEPQSVRAHCNLAWLLTAWPEPKLQDPPRALEAARKAVQLDSQSDLAWQVLGWAQYRMGDWKASIDALEKSIALQKDPPGGDAFQWFFLAMAHARRGNADEARKWYDRAVKWLEQNAPNNEEGRRFQAEAEGLLKKEPAGPDKAAAGKKDTGQK
jgi:serine/threonine protein kinase/tetratricopeptide (TPR) repeat protein